MRPPRLGLGLVSAFGLLITGCAAPCDAPDCLPASECSCGDPAIDAVGCPAQCCLDNTACRNDHCPCCATPAR